MKKWYGFIFTLIFSIFTSTTALASHTIELDHGIKIDLSDDWKSESFTTDVDILDYKF